MSSIKVYSFGSCLLLLAGSFLSSGPALAARAIALVPPAVNAPIELATMSAPGTDERVNLKEMGETTSRMERTLSDINHEVDRRQTTIGDDEGFNDPFLYDFDPTLEFPYPQPGNDVYSYNSGKLLPARSKWLSHFMTQLNGLLDILQGDVAAIALPDSQQCSPGPMLEVLHDTLQNVRQKAQNLDALTRSKEIDNLAIAKLTAEMKDDVSGMEDLRKKLLKQLNGEPADSQ